jgi:hemerythrin-like metal-binding protein
MRELIFTQDLRSEHPGIDRQHEAMFVWAGKITSSSSEIERQEMARVVNFLGTYVRYHFAAEEFMMAQHGYDRAAPHCRQHDALRNEVKSIQDGASEGVIARLLVARIHALFVDWYIYHIREWDLPLACFLRTKDAAEGGSELPAAAQLMDAGKLRAGDDRNDLSAIEVVDQGAWRHVQKAL